MSYGGHHGRTARRREVKVHDAERTQLLQRRLLVGCDAHEIEMFHPDNHDCGALPLAILPRVTAAVCSSPIAILILRIASLHSGIFTFSKRFTR